MKQDKINFDDNPINDIDLNIEDIARKFKSISKLISNSTSEMSVLYSEQLKRLIGSNTIEISKRYEEISKSLLGTLDLSSVYSETLNKLLPQFEKIMNQYNSIDLEKLSSLSEHAGKLLSIIDSATVSSNKQISNEEDNLANQIVDDLNAIVATNSSSQIPLPVEKKDKWTRSEKLELIALFITIVLFAIDHFLSQDPSIQINNTFNIENVNIYDSELSDENKNDLQYILDDEKQQNK